MCDVCNGIGNCPCCGDDDHYKECDNCCGTGIADEETGETCDVCDGTGQVIDENYYEDLEDAYWDAKFEDRRNN
jgi:RecJ-like exonuclease